MKFHVSHTIWILATVICNQRFQLWFVGILIDHQLSEQMGKTKLLTFCHDPQKWKTTVTGKVPFLLKIRKQNTMAFLAWSRENYNLVYLRKHLEEIKYGLVRSRTNMQNHLFTAIYVGALCIFHYIGFIYSLLSKNVYTICICKLMHSIMWIKTTSFLSIIQFCIYHNHFRILNMCIA